MEHNFQPTTTEYLPPSFSANPLAYVPSLRTYSPVTKKKRKQFVWAIGNYDQTRDIVDARHCYAYDDNDPSVVAPPDVSSWNCGDLASTFTVTCGCSTPSPASLDTPSTVAPSPSTGSRDVVGGGPSPAPTIAAPDQNATS